MSIKCSSAGYGKKMYRVKYIGQDSQTHNAYYFDEYYPALLEYMRISVEQLQEHRYLTEVKLEELGVDNKYHAIFKQLNLHPIECEFGTRMAAALGRD